MIHKTITLFGYASDVAGACRGSSLGIEKLKNSEYFNSMQKNGLKLDWQTIVQPDFSLPSNTRIVQRLSQELSLLTTTAVLERKFFVVLGGDHTSAIGTWSGVSHAKHAEGPIGLIWIDAHLDSHTPETSETENLHGMPLACLLGKGDSLLTSILRPDPKLKPENICIIGARSFEAGELNLLNQLKVRIFFMDEVNKRGVVDVMREAIHIVTQHTSAYGISLDIDSIDPHDAPGTGVPEPDGITGKQLIQALKLMANDPNFIGAEIVEFDPSRDKDHMTEKLIPDLIRAFILGEYS